MFANNIAFVYAPHHLTESFRVSCMNQKGEDANYIVITCSPTYNGLGEYESKKTKNFDIGKNGKLDCYVVPICECRKIKDLNEIGNPKIIENIKKQQDNWYNNKVKNNPHSYKSKPQGML